MDLHNLLDLNLSIKIGIFNNQLFTWKYDGTHISDLKLLNISNDMNPISVHSEWGIIYILFNNNKILKCSVDKFPNFDEVENSYDDTIGISNGMIIHPNKFRMVDDDTFIELPFDCHKITKIIRGGGSIHIIFDNQLYTFFWLMRIKIT